MKIVPWDGRANAGESLTWSVEVGTGERLEKGRAKERKENLVDVAFLGGNCGCNPNRQQDNSQKTLGHMTCTKSFSAQRLGS